MTDIKLITPPDRLYTNEASILSVYPSKFVKEELQTVLLEVDIPIHLYLYEKSEDEHQYEWLVDVFQQADCVILDIDNCPPEVRDITGYFLSRDKTFWLTKGENLLYNVISNNRVYSLDFIPTLLGGKFETVQQ
jgi:hypothetical protein